MIFHYTPSGVCSRLFEIEVENEHIIRISIIGGCHGNSQGVAALLKGMSIKEAVARLEGICCGSKNTSCPDQIA